MPETIKSKRDLMLAVSFSVVQVLGEREVYFTPDIFNIAMNKNPTRSFGSPREMAQMLH